MTIQAKEMLGAAQRCDLPKLEALLARGGDPNASYRKYRPLHALIQENPHASEPRATRERLRAIDLLLEHGASPDALGAWPPARATLVAAFVGSRPIVEKLLAGGASRNLFVSAALGDRADVARRLKADADAARSRDDGGLTALQCCAASALGRRDPKVARSLLAVAKLLLDHGADPNAATRSWAHDVVPTYFAAHSGNEAMFELLI